MKKQILRTISLILILIFAGCVKETYVEIPANGNVNNARVNSIRIYRELPEKLDTNAKYLFYLHDKIVEDEGAKAVSPEFGEYQYQEILETFAKRGFIVLSEVRPKDTVEGEYARKATYQVLDLLNKGVTGRNITIVGVGKGAKIAHRISSDVHSPTIHYVLLAGCGKDFLPYTTPSLSGNVLSIYDSMDKTGVVSCQDFFEKSKSLNSSKEIQLKLGLGHGVFYRPLPEWVEPVIEWASQNQN